MSQSGILNPTGPGTGVTSILGTANQVLANGTSGSAETGAVTLTTPQNIATSSAVRFGSLTLNGALDASSILSMYTTNQGFLPPTLSTAQKNAIASPAEGLVLYDKDLDELQFYNGTSWVGTTTSGVTSATGTANQVLVNGTSGSAQTGALTFTTPQDIGTSSNVQFNRVGIGSASSFDLDVSKSTAGSFVAGRIRNSSASAASDSVLFMQTSNGSAYTTYTINVSTPWTIGVDSADSNRFKFTPGASIGVSDVLTLLSASVFVNSALTVGSATPQANTQVTLNPTGQYGLYMTSTMSLAGVALYASRINNIISPSTAFATYGYAFTGVFNAVSGRTIPNAYAFYSDLSCTAAGGTLTNVFNYYASAGTSTAGTLSNMYGFFCAALSVGTNRYGGYFIVPSGGTIALALYTEGMSSGYAVTAPSNGIIVSGFSGFGTSAPATGTGLAVGYALSGSSGNLFAVNVSATYTSSSSTVAAAAAVYTNAAFTATGAITASYGIFVDVGSSSGAGGITTHYGLRIAAQAISATTAYGLHVTIPSSGTNKYTAYFDTGVGIGTTNLPATSALRISTSAQYNLYLSGTQTADDGGSTLCIVMAPTLNPANNNRSTYALYCGPVHAAVTAQTISSAAAVYVTQSFGGNAGTITNAYGILISGGGATVGTISTHYGLYVVSPVGGTTKICAYFEGGIGIGAAPAGNIGVNYNITLLTSDGSAAGIFSQGPIGANVAATISTAASVFAQPTFTNNAGTITSACGLYVQGGSGAGTITNGIGLLVDVISYGTTRYGIYVSTPSGGSTNICAYFAGAIKCGLNSTGAGSAALGSNCPAVTASAPYTWVTFTAADNSTCYLPIWK